MTCLVEDLITLNRVSRKALFRKLQELGIAGSVYDLKQDMYTNDVLFIQINGELLKARYLT